METNNTPEFVQDNYRDYNGSTFFAVNKCVNVRITPVLLNIKKSAWALLPGRFYLCSVPITRQVRDRRSC